MNNAAARLVQTRASQTKVNLLLDRTALQHPGLLFKNKGSGFDRFAKLFYALIPQDLNDELIRVLFERILRDQAQNKVKSMLIKKEQLDKCSSKSCKLTG